MITKSEHEAVLFAREATGFLEDAKWLPVLKQYGEVDSIEDLDRRGYDRLVGFFFLHGFIDPRRMPIIEEDYQLSVRLWAEMASLDPIGLKALMYAIDAEDIASLYGASLRRVFNYFSHLGIAKPDDLARAVMSRKQLALLNVAKRETNMSDKDFRSAHIDIGGVLRPQDLSQRGFDRLLSFFEVLGFVPPSRAAKPTKRPSYGRRPGMASPAQVQLVRDLWREWSGADDQDALNAWLEKYHHVSNLRFLSAATAGHVLTALKAMKARRRHASPDTAA